MEIANNYIIFSSTDDETHVLPKPPVVAFHYRGEPFEEWNPDKLGEEVKGFTLDKAKQVNGRRRWLRTRNPTQPHRHIMFELNQRDALTWRTDFMRLIRRCRNSSSP